MSRRNYDRLMIATKIGTNRKIRRLRPEQRWAHVAGVLALAAESPIPGHLLIAEGIPVEATDVAEQASVTVKIAEATLAQLRKLGLVKFDEEIACEYVHDWDEWNPAPKNDRTAADRMRRYRERLRNDDRNEGRNDRNGYEPVRQEREVEVEREVLPTATTDRSEGTPDGPAAGLFKSVLTDLERRAV